MKCSGAAGCFAGTPEWTRTTDARLKKRALGRHLECCCDQRQGCLADVEQGLRMLEGWLVVGRESPGSLPVTANSGRRAAAARRSEGKDPTRGALGAGIPRRAAVLTIAATVLRRDRALARRTALIRRRTCPRHSLSPGRLLPS